MANLTFLNSVILKDTDIPMQGELRLTADVIAMVPWLISRDRDSPRLFRSISRTELRDKKAEREPETAMVSPDYRKDVLLLF